MYRRDVIKKTGLAASGLLFSKYLNANNLFMYASLEDCVKSDFGADFKWRVTAASYQTEGAWNLDGKGE
jgi:hypothetical protein